MPGLGCLRFYKIQVGVSNKLEIIFKSLQSTQLVDPKFGGLGFFGIYWNEPTIPSDCKFLVGYLAGGFFWQPEEFSWGLFFSISVNFQDSNNSWNNIQQLSSAWSQYLGLFGIFWNESKFLVGHLVGGFFWQHERTLCNLSWFPGLGENDNTIIHNKCARKGLKWRVRDSRQPSFR